MHVCMYVCMYVCMFVCMYACMYVLYLYTYVCMYVCMHACMYVCTYVRVCVCVCQCTDPRLIPDEWHCGGQRCSTCTPLVPPRLSFLILPSCKDDASGSKNSVLAACALSSTPFSRSQKALPTLPRSLSRRTAACCHCGCVLGRKFNVLLSLAVLPNR